MAQHQDQLEVSDDVRFRFRGGVVCGLPGLAVLAALVVSGRVAVCVKVSKQLDSKHLLPWTCGRC